MVRPEQATRESGEAFACAHRVPETMPHQADRPRHQLPHRERRHVAEDPEGRIGPIPPIGSGEANHR